MDMKLLRAISLLLWNSQERRLRALWRVLLQLLIFVVLNGVVGALFAPIIYLLGGNLYEIYGTTNSFVWLQVIGAIASLVATLISLLIAGKLLDHRPFTDFGFHLCKDWWIDLGFGLLLGAFLMLFIFCIEYLAGWLTVVGTLQSNMEHLPFSKGLIMSIVLFLCVGIYEEAFSRGYHLRNFSEGLNFPALGAQKALFLAWLFSSIIFGFLHLGNPHASLISTINIAIAGLFLGLGFILTGELAISIGLHITWNLFQGIIFGFPVSGTIPFVSILDITQKGPELFTGGAFGPEAGLVGLMAMVLGGGLTVLWVHNRYGKVSLQERLAVYDRSSERIKNSKDFLESAGG